MLNPKRRYFMKVSAVKLRNSFQICYIEKNDVFLNQNTLSVVETEHGVDLGNVVKFNKCGNCENIQITGKIIRKATEDDIAQIPAIEELEKKAYDVCREKAKARELSMKLITVKVLFDRTKVIFYFVAENRVDFRELVRELASVFRMRIEMRQIGVRDDARLVKGYGPCGRIQCCVNQLDEFEPVSIKMAKEQNLNLNSLKISGMCGRLLCCLCYEYETYTELSVGMPEIGDSIACDDTLYTVISTDILKQTMRIRDHESVFDIAKADLETKDNSFYIKKDVINRIKGAEDDAKDEFYD
jgi:cell fate regulator YaaT (PSP1 superfamily)